MQNIFNATKVLIEIHPERYLGINVGGPWPQGYDLATFTSRFNFLLTPAEITETMVMLFKLNQQLFLRVLCEESLVVFNEDNQIIGRTSIVTYLSENYI